jgi:hypothetical protein
MIVAVVADRHKPMICKPNGKSQTQQSNGWGYHRPILAMVEDDLYIILYRFCERWNTKTQIFTRISPLPWSAIQARGYAFYIHHLHSLLVIRQTSRVKGCWWRGIEEYGCYLYDIHSDRWSIFRLNCPFYQKNATFLLIDSRPLGSCSDTKTVSDASSEVKMVDSSLLDCHSKGGKLVIMASNQIWWLPISAITLSLVNKIPWQRSTITTCENNNNPSLVSLTSMFFSI